MEKAGQFASVRLADRPRSFEHVGGDAARSEYGDEVALPKSAIFHEDEAATKPLALQASLQKAILPKTDVGQ